MTFSDRRRPTLRLTDDQFDRLERVRRRLGQTAQSYMAAAVMQKLEADEAKLRMAKDERRQRREDREGRRLDSAPTGLGIVPRRAPEADDLPPEPAAPPPVVVNVGSPTPQGTGGDLISRLAAFVTKGSDFDQERRMRQAVEMLRASCSEEERLTLAAELDAAVAAKTKEHESAGPAAGVRRAASVAFDQIKGLLG